MIHRREGSLNTGDNVGWAVGGHTALGTMLEPSQKLMGFGVGIFGFCEPDHLLLGYRGWFCGISRRRVCVCGNGSLDLRSFSERYNINNPQHMRWLEVKNYVSSAKTDLLGLFQIRASF